MRPTTRSGGLALVALGLIALVTAAWWALALWPIGRDGPAWVAVTREVCFGAAPEGLPSAGGWLLLVGQPLGMLAVLTVGWPREVRAGLGLLLAHLPGQVTAGAAAAVLVVGIGGVAVRVADAGADRFATGWTPDPAARLTRVDNPAPAMALTDQHGRTIVLEAFAGRPVLVTFAFAHCETVCPLVVDDVRDAAARLEDVSPVVLVLTLDPWRDTPGRLASMAEAWGLTGDAHVLSHADTMVVERVLNAWRIPRVRNERTGDVSHPSLVYVLDRRGRITYAVPGGVEQIVAAVRAL